VPSVEDDHVSFQDLTLYVLFFVCMCAWKCVYVRTLSHSHELMSWVR